MFLNSRVWFLKTRSNVSYTLSKAFPQKQIERTDNLPISTESSIMNFETNFGLKVEFRMLLFYSS